MRVNLGTLGYAFALAARVQEEGEGVLVGFEEGKTASHEGVGGEGEEGAFCGFRVAADDGVEGEEGRGREGVEDGEAVTKGNCREREEKRENVRNDASMVVGGGEARNDDVCMDLLDLVQGRSFWERRQECSS